MLNKNNQLFHYIFCTFYVSSYQTAKCQQMGALRAANVNTFSNWV